MAEKLTHYCFTPESGRVSDGKIVVNALGFNSTEATVRPRLQAVANLLGVRLVAVQRPGTDTTRFDPQLRRDLGDRKRFVEMCEDYASQFVADCPAIADFPQRLVEGDSGGGVLALGMVAARARFATHLLIREAFDHRATASAPEKQLAGALRVIREQLPDLPYLDRAKPSRSLSRSTVQLQDDRTLGDKLRAGARSLRTGYVEMRHWGTNSCSNMSQVLAAYIAAERPGVALNMIDYEYGLGGDAERTRALADLLPTLRPADGAPVVTFVDPMLRHNALLDPARQARDIASTFALYAA